MVSPLFDLFHDLMGKTGETVAAMPENILFPMQTGMENGKKACRLRCTPFFEDRFRVEGLFGRDGECFPAERFLKTCASFRIVRR